MKKGFTLIELLAVIAILAIIMMVAMPSVMGMFNLARAGTFHTEIINVCNAAKISYYANKKSNGDKVVLCNTSTCTNTGTIVEKALDNMKNIEYLIEMEGKAKITKLIITNDVFYYMETGEDIDCKKLGDVISIDSTHEKPDMSSNGN